MAIKNCNYCGKQFTTTNHQIYCCRECYKKAKEELKKAEQQKRIKKKEKLESLPKTEAIARSLGMSYGKYKAMKFIEEMRL